MSTSKTSNVQKKLSIYSFSSVIPSSLLGGFTRSEFHDHLENRLLAIWSPQAEPFNDSLTMEKAFWAIDYNYAPWPYVEDEYENRDAFNEVFWLNKIKSPNIIY